MRRCQAIFGVKTTTSGFFGSIKVGLFLSLANILLVTNSFVTKPVGYLRDGYPAFASQFFFGFLTGIWVA